MPSHNIFSFKQKSQDFIVEEQLPFEPSGKGDALLVYIEKQNKNTMDIINHLCSTLKISRMTIGVAGLKDKRAITRQWISIYQSALKKLGGEKIFVDTLAQVSRILTITHHDKPIGLTTPIQNIFHIRLRAQKKLSQSEKHEAKKLIQNLFSSGFPNYFGEQRFGINGRNRKQGKDFIKWIDTIKDKKEIVFKLQAFASKMFNDYIDLKLKSTSPLVEGDIVLLSQSQEYGIFHQTQKVQYFHDAKWCPDFFYYPQQANKEIDYNAHTMYPTWPVIGYNTLLCNPKTAAGKIEQQFLKQKSLTPETLKIMEQYKVFGLRRQLTVYPSQTKLTYQSEDLLIRFALPSGSYASVLIDIMMQKLIKS